MNLLEKYKDCTITIISKAGNEVLTQTNDEFATENESVFNWNVCQTGNLLYSDTGFEYKFIGRIENNVILYQLGA